MKRIYAVMLALISTALAVMLSLAFNSLIDKSEQLVASNAQVNYPQKVIIDAGHGDFDGGAVGIDKSIEKNINLSISIKLSLLCNIFGVETIMTRTDDSTLCDEGLKSIREKKVSDIRNRTALANKNQDAILLSIHQNSFTDSKYQGTQVFYSPNNEKSLELALALQDSVTALLQKNNTRKIKKSENNIYLLKNSTIPSVMVECGFLSNYDEARLLNDDEYQKELCLAMLDGLFTYFDSEDYYATKK